MTDARTERAREAAIEFVRKEPNSLPWVSQQNRLIEAFTAFAADEVAREWNIIIAHFVSKGTVPSARVVHELNELRNTP